MSDAPRAPHASITERSVSRMRVLRLLTAVAVAGLVGAGVVACARTVDGRGTIAAGVVTPGTTESGSPTGTPSPTASPTPSESPSPTVDPVKAKERVTCVLVQATVKTTNDKFNAAKTRAQQVKVLESAATSIDGTLKRSGLDNTSKVYLLGRAILVELRRIVQSAKRGGNPTTGPYNTLTTRFRTACLNI
jgi:hypothetical protein